MGAYFLYGCKGFQWVQRFQVGTEVLQADRGFRWVQRFQNEIEKFSGSYRMSLIRHQRRTFLLCKETGMQKWARMLMKTGKAFSDPSAMMTQMREDSDIWSLSPLMILCWHTLLVITKHPEDGPGIAQVDNTTTRLITFIDR